MNRLAVVSFLCLVLSRAGAVEWVNAIRDPGAELDAGWWTVETYGDSSRASAHDSALAYSGTFSFLTDVYAWPVGAQLGDTTVAKCIQKLAVPKAVKDIASDSGASWYAWFRGTGPYYSSGQVTFRSTNRHFLTYHFGGFIGYADTDSTKVFKYTIPETTWAGVVRNLKTDWTMMGLKEWPDTDSICEVKLAGVGLMSDPYWWGVLVHWDDVRLVARLYYDLTVKAITSGARADTFYIPAATFENRGIRNESSAVVHATIRSGQEVVYSDTQQILIPAGGTAEVSFARWTVPSTEVYQLEVFTALANDEIPENDTLAKTIQGYAFGVAEDGGAGNGSRAKAPSLTLERNPTRGAMTVRYVLPAGESGTLDILDVTGRVVRSYVLSASDARSPHSLLFTPHCLPGVLFLRLSSSGRSVTAKIVKVE